MAGILPDLTPIIIDWETGEVVFQGQEDPEVDFCRACARENMNKWCRERREERARRAAEQATPQPDAVPHKQTQE